MQLLTIINNSHKEYVLDKVKDIITYLKDKEIFLHYKIQEDNKLEVIEIYNESSDKEEDKKIVQYYIACILYSIAVEDFLTKDINKHLNEMYNFLNYKDIEMIKEIVNKVLKEEIAVDETIIFCMNRKNEAIQKIVNCMDEFNELNVKGFLDFRFKEISRDIYIMIEKIVEKYMVEKEYNEFISLLRYFVEVQDCKIERVDLFISDYPGEYILKDDFGNDLMDSFFNDLCENKTVGDISKDDLLISGLITICPRKIVIHSVEKCKNKELISTISSVFKERVEYCDKEVECIDLRDHISHHPYNE